VEHFLQKTHVIELEVWFVLKITYRNNQYIHLGIDLLCRKTHVVQFGEQLLLRKIYLIEFGVNFSYEKLCIWGIA